MTLLFIAVHVVHRLGYALHLLGVTMFSNSGSLYVSLCCVALLYQ